METTDIWKLLPHRYPFLLVDRVLEIKNDEHITCLKNVTINEPMFTGHFPDAPVFSRRYDCRSVGSGGGYPSFSLKRANFRRWVHLLFSRYRSDKI